MKRYLSRDLQADLREKMVFLGGPRQVGKTTLALSLLLDDATESHPAYLTWDSPATRKLLLQGALPEGQPLIVFVRNRKPQFAVECKTGEARLSRNIAYFAERTNIPEFYQVHKGHKDLEIVEHRARVLSMTALSRILAV